MSEGQRALWGCLFSSFASINKALSVCVFIYMHFPSYLHAICLLFFLYDLFLELLLSYPTLDDRYMHTPGL